VSPDEVTLGREAAAARVDGFYWVRLPVRGNVEVARWCGADGDGNWYVAGWDGAYDTFEVTVLSERLLPPEVKSDG
jgi:hypothetical protein